MDDGSSDATWTLLNQFIDYFGGRQVVRLVRHEARRGVAAAISTGLAHAQAEIVASLDADCTYDPMQLVPMLGLLAPNVDLVVASPYHPEGCPGRGELAAGDVADGFATLPRNNAQQAAHLYQLRAGVSPPLRHRSAVQHGGFVGIVELVWQLDRRGGKIVECPAVLTTRKVGQSKMRDHPHSVRASVLPDPAGWQACCAAAGVNRNRDADRTELPARLP